jgi:FlaA1/EpsC-like NDP-sugar epimerase
LIIQGVRVIGNGSCLEKISKAQQVQIALIAIQSAEGAQMATILKHCATAGLAFRIVPALAEGVRKFPEQPPVRGASVEDLLGRRQVHIDGQVVRAKIDGKAVLVTGAAGSIGAELCRQIAQYNPALIVGLDISESGLFYVEQDLKAFCPNVSFVPVVGSVLQHARLEELFVEYTFSAVFHAAAYKHVPLMETHPFEACENNIIGTYKLASSAGRFGVRHFIMISTDKAVRPSSIMGLTKRAAEIVVSSLQSSMRGTEFVSVRFGNVLGSSGSVVPIFRRQIASGGPVTVTHREMRRYFMSIPEAVQLVLQASSMGHGGEIFVLDMGDPIRIVDLATNMILLSGRQPGKDIQIKFTGMRPGEKLCEELAGVDEATLPTYHERIRIFSGDRVQIPCPELWINELYALCHARDFQLLWFLKALVADYNPSHSIQQKMLERSRQAGVSARGLSATSTWGAA